MWESLGGSEPSAVTIPTRIKRAVRSAWRSVSYCLHGLPCRRPGEAPAKDSRAIAILAVVTSPRRRLAGSTGHTCVLVCSHAAPLDVSPLRLDLPDRRDRT